MKFKFFVKNLFDSRVIELSFKDRCLILLSENGQGKTTLLKMLHYLLSGNYSDLIDIKFSELGFIFDDNEKISIQYSELNNLEEKYYKIIREQVARPINFSTVSISEQEKLIETIFEMIRGNFKFRKTNIELISGLDSLELINHRNLNLRRELQKVLIMHNYPIMRADIILRKISSAEDRQDSYISDNVKTKLEVIRKYFSNITPLFLPTYRRIEAEFRGLDNELLTKLGDQNMNFGMGDILSRIQELTQEINAAARKAYSNVTGQILTNMLKHINSQIIDNQSEYANNISKNKNKVNIALNRVGDSISSNDKEDILKIINNGDYETSTYSFVTFVVSQLLDAFQAQESKSNALSHFAEICNKYLFDKYLSYDESEASITFYKKNSGVLEEIDVKNLSSGEKQMISIFAKIFLYPEKKYFVLFDEPELSISLEWQKMLLPDILSSQNCEYLFATTHSPFIFDNELITNTKDLTKCYGEING